MKEVRIKLKKGVDASVTSTITNLAWHFKSEIVIEKGGKTARATSLLFLACLELCAGDDIILRAKGVDEDDAISLLKKAFDTAFLNDEVINEILTR